MTQPKSKFRWPLEMNIVFNRYFEDFMQELTEMDVSGIHRIDEQHIEVISVYDKPEIINILRMFPKLERLCVSIPFQFSYGSRWYTRTGFVDIWKKIL